MACHTTFMHLADTFIQSDLQCIQAIHFLGQYVWSLGIKPTTFALLMQCSNHWATGTTMHILHVQRQWDVEGAHETFCFTQTSPKFFNFSGWRAEVLPREMQTASRKPRFTIFKMWWLQAQKIKTTQSSHPVETWPLTDQCYSMVK